MLNFKLFGPLGTELQAPPCLRTRTLLPPFILCVCVCYNFEFEYKNLSSHKFCNLISKNCFNWYFVEAPSNCSNWLLVCRNFCKLYCKFYWMPMAMRLYQKQHNDKFLQNIFWFYSLIPLVRLFMPKWPLPYLQIDFAIDPGTFSDISGQFNSNDITLF